MANISLGSVYAAIGLSLLGFFYAFSIIKNELVLPLISSEIVILIILSALQFYIMSKDHPHELELKKLEIELEKVKSKR